jgi:hypothetical protein
MDGGMKKSAADNDTLQARFESWLGLCRDHYPAWTKDAMVARKYYDGDQWDVDDRAFLEEQLRPVITFNKVAPYIDAIVGDQINSRQDIVCIPRGVEDQAAAMALTEVLRWIRDRCGSPFQETSAFKDALVTGIGWLHVYMDYDRFPGGEIRVEAISPFDVFLDPRSERPAGEDARFIIRNRWMERDEFEETWPDAEAVDYDTNADTLDEVMRPLDANKMWKYQDSATTGGEKRKNKVCVKEVQWWDSKDVYTVFNPDGSYVESEDKVQGAILRKKKVYYRAFYIGGNILDQSVSPFPSGFTYIPVVGKLDRGANVYYGIVRAMTDPQQYINKFFSSMMHVINSNSKGGLLMELDAVDDIRRMEAEWAQPNSITFLRPGGLSKIKEKSPAAFPQGIEELFRLANGAMRDVTGISLEFLGMANRQQARVLEVERKESTANILSQYIDNLRWARIAMGRVLVYYIRSFVPEGVLNRLGYAAASVVFNDIEREYDIIIEEAPESMSFKNRVWTELAPMLPMLSNMEVPPSVIAEFLRFSPLPSQVVDRILQTLEGYEQQKMQIEAAKNQPAPTPQEAPQSPLDIAKTQAEIEVLQEKARLDRAKAMATGAQYLDSVYGRHDKEGP